jgi:hypothetical protein
MYIGDVIAVVVKPAPKRQHMVKFDQAFLSREESLGTRLHASLQPWHLSKDCVN